jgi:hypothetical protein
MLSLHRSPPLSSGLGPCGSGALYAIVSCCFEFCVFGGVLVGVQRFQENDLGLCVGSPELAGFFYASFLLLGLIELDVHFCGGAHMFRL